jgi:hypothetical protein
LVPPRAAGSSASRVCPFAFTSVHRGRAGIARSTAS